MLLGARVPLVGWCNLLLMQVFTANASVKFAYAKVLDALVFISIHVCRSGLGWILVEFSLLHTWFEVDMSPSKQVLMWVGLFVVSFFFLVLWSCGGSSRVGQVDVILLLLHQI